MHARRSEPWCGIAGLVSGLGLNHRVHLLGIGRSRCRRRNLSLGSVPAPPAPARELPSLVRDLEQVRQHKVICRPLGGSHRGLLFRPLTHQYFRMTDAPAVLHSYIFLS